MKLGSLIVEIGADTANFVKGVSDTKIQLTGLDTQVVRGAKNLALFGAAAAAAAAGGLAAMTVAGMKSIEATGDLANQLNTTSSSIVTLSRAGDLAGVSFEKISAAGRMLTLNLGKAVDSASPAAIALDRLHLSADTLAQMPLDQRISTINDALQKFVPATEQAAVAADLFGAKAALAVSKLDGDSIRQAADQTRILGLQLSELDSTKVNQASDAMGVFEMAAKGVENQLAIALSPIIRQISMDFLDATGKAGGLAAVTKDAVHSVITAMAGAANAVDGVGRVFSTVADTILLVWQGMATTLIEIVNAIISTMDKALESVGNTSMKKAAVNVQKGADEIAGITREITAHMQEQFDKPLAGDAIEAYVAKAEAASNQLANMSINAPKQDTSQQVKGVDKGAEEAAKAAAEAAAKAKAKADAEAAAEQSAFESRLARLQSQNETVQNLDAEHNQAMADLFRAREEGKITDINQYNAMQESIAQDHAEKVSAIENAAAEQRAAMEKNRQQTLLTGTSQMFGNLSTLMNSGSRRLFEIGKTAAIANAIVNTAMGVTQALAHFPPPLSFAMAAAQSAAGLVQIQAIRSQTFGGGGGSPSSAGSATTAVNAASTPVQPAGASGAPSQFTVAGLDPGALFTGAQVRSLMTRMNEESRSGSKLTFAA